MNTERAVRLREARVGVHLHEFILDLVDGQAVFETVLQGSFQPFCIATGREGSYGNKTLVTGRQGCGA